VKTSELVRQRDEAAKTALDCAIMLLKLCEAIESGDEVLVVKRNVEARLLLKRIRGEK